jgi:site-specific DNA-adenine methylase
MSVEIIPLSCIGRKDNELKYLLPIIKENINEDTIFIEPFCGSCIVSYNVFKLNTVKEFHINDIDEMRMKFYNDITDISKREEFYKIQDDIIENGPDEYYIYEDKTELGSEYISYLFEKRIGTFMFGSFPGKISSTKISDNWMEFLTIANKTNDDWKVIMEKYKDNKNAFIYLDPPYFNMCNNIYTEHDDKKIYIDIVDYLKNSKCKILFSVNKNIITEYIYKDYINNTLQKNKSILTITNF